MNNDKFSFGNSGSIISLHNTKVRKSWPSNNNRLKKQIEKQSNFVPHDVFKSPEILDWGWEDNNLYFEMEYINGATSIDYFSLIDKNGIDLFSKNLISFLEMQIKKSEFQFVSVNILFNKIENIKITNELKVKITNFIQKITTMNDLLLPVGKCHGDLTFANMIFKNNEIYLIDFLDCFLESPIQDIVKIRQETKGFWSLLINKKECDLIKLKLNFTNLDANIDNHFKKYVWYKKYVDVFEILNYARILPYVEKNAALEDKILKLINNIILKQ